MLKNLSLERKNEIYMYIFILPGIIGFLFFWLIPIIYTFVLSLYKTNGLTFQFVGFMNFYNIFKSDLYWKSVFNTGYMVLLGVPCNMIFALFLAMLLNRKVAGLSFYRTIFYIPTILPGVATSILMLTLLNTKYGLFNKVLGFAGIQNTDWLGDPRLTKLAFVYMGTWAVGNMMIIFLVGLQGIPITYYEAAVVDGANPVKQFFYVTLPQLTPTILYNLIVQIVLAIQIFTPAYIMTNGGPDQSTYFYVYKMWRDGFQNMKLGTSSAESVVLFLASLGLTYVIMKFSNSWVHYEGGN